MGLLDKGSVFIMFNASPFKNKQNKYVIDENTNTKLIEINYALVVGLFN